MSNIAYYYEAILFSHHPIHNRQRTHDNENSKMINLLKKLLQKRDNSKKFDTRVWIQLALLNKNLKSLKY